MEVVKTEEKEVRFVNPFVDWDNFWIFAKEKIRHPGVQRHFFNTGWQFIGTFIMMPLTFLVNIYIARNLGPVDYGILNYVISFVGLFAVLSATGIDSILLRELSISKERKDVLIGTSFILKIIGALISIIAIVIAIFFGKHSMYENTLILLYSSTLIFNSFNSVVGVFFQASVLAKKTVIVQLTSTLLVTFYKVFIIVNHLGAAWIILAYVLDGIILSIGAYYIYTKYNDGKLSWKYDAQTARFLLRDSWPIMFSGLAGMIYLKIDQVMIRNMLDNYQLGIYSSAVKLCEVWYFIPGTIAGSLFPAIINAKKVNEHFYNMRLRKLYWLLIAIALTIAIPVTFLSSWIITIIFGSAYIGAGTILSIYIWAGIPAFLGTAITLYLIAENKTKKLFIITSGGATINIILNLILIPKIGIIGSAYATLVSYTAVPLLLLAWSDTRGQIAGLFKLS
jgi:O-antigen/teichoic acid export membrane protein